MKEDRMKEKTTEIKEVSQDIREKALETKAEVTEVIEARIVGITGTLEAAPDQK